MCSSDSKRLEPSAIDYHLRAVVRQRMGDTEGAKSDLAEAKRLDPNLERDAGMLILSRPPLRKLVEQQEVK